MADKPSKHHDSTDNQTTRTESSSHERRPHSAALDAELPPDLQRALGRFLGTDPVETLGECAEAMRRLVAGDSISVDVLCVTDETTKHVGIAGEKTYHFACFYDAVILAAIEDRAVDIRTESPAGTRIEAHAVGTDELTVSPESAVFSFGIETGIEPPSSDGLRLERGYAAICPYVRAFPDRDAYDTWAATVPATTIAMPLSGATAFAAALVE